MHDFGLFRGRFRQVSLYHETEIKLTDINMGGGIVAVIAWRGVLDTTLCDKVCQ